VLQKMIQAGVRNGSYMEASRELSESAELSIGAKAIERAVRRIGIERAAERDEATAAFMALPLPERNNRCPQPKAPTTAVVQFDCGRMLVLDRNRASTPTIAVVPAGPGEVDPGKAEEDAHRAERLGEAAMVAAAQCSAEAAADQLSSEETQSTDGESHVDESRSQHWRDHKVGCLVTMQSAVHAEDPCPEIPANFLEIGRVTKLVREMGHCTPAASPASSGTAHSEASDEEKPEPKRPGAPVPLVRTILASRACSQVFGAMLVAAAWARGFAAAPSKAFVADGAAMNWTMWAQYFSHYKPILDFIHALQYIYAAAMAGRCFGTGWSTYCRWIQAVWAGRVAEVIVELQQRQWELGEPGKDSPTTDPRKIVSVTLAYLQTHEQRMDYACYRRLGLPIMSCYAESAVKQINRRVKGTEKFWGEAGAEAILQLRADYLSETEPLSRFWKKRQEKATGQRYGCAV